ncbi:hypothetical protein RF55_16076 [Lasius niger]|uniref:Uncharacterized protein n=1 Tax=Lasius niger TaxID=67767 RepID=A0A0J7K501_LASNI|nr:hypothetical protein RF55_16076 [Lasius niger]
MRKSEDNPPESLPEEVQQLLLLQRQTIHRIARAVDNFKKLGKRNITLACTKGQLEQLEKTSTSIKLNILSWNS